MYTDHRFEAPAASLLTNLLSQPSNNSPRSIDRPLALYGAGSLGRMAREYFAQAGFTDPVAFVVDRNAVRLQGDSFWRDVDLRHPDEVAAATRAEVLLAVCVVTSAYSPIDRELRAAGWSDVVPFYDVVEAYRDRHPLGNGWMLQGPAAAADMERIDAVYHGWSDDTSRAHYLQFLAWRRLRQDWSFRDAPVTIDDRFFIPEVREALTAHERFLDVGAHVGGVARRFIETVGGQFDELVAVEPDPASGEKLAAALSPLPIRLIPQALGRESGTASFCGGLGYASQCSALGKTAVPVARIDDLDLHPSFIKLHVEGAELDVLQGATGTVERTRPILALTAYHNADGVWKLPHWVMEHCQRYRYYFRMHGWCGTGAVIYAIPSERMSPQFAAVSEFYTAASGGDLFKGRGD